MEETVSFLVGLSFIFVILIISFGMGVWGLIKDLMHDMKFLSKPVKLWNSSSGLFQAFEILTTSTRSGMWLPHFQTTNSSWIGETEHGPMC